MRITFLLIGAVALVLGACSNKSSYAPPPLDKTLLTGKWRNVSTLQFLAGFDFNADGTMRMRVQGMKDAIPGRYTWTGERTLEVEYSKEADVQKAYEEAAKTFKESVADRIKKKEMDGKAGPSLMGTAKGKLPDKETFVVGISDPRFLNLIRERGASESFGRVD